jgi:glycosyltransferase involved in cell wall biosynthesis
LFFKAGFSDVIFSNTITNGRLLKILSPFRKKIVTYVHELENVIEWYMPSGNSAYSLQYSQRFAYPSLRVTETLQHKYNVDRSKLYRLLYYFPVDLIFINDESAKNNFANAFRQKFNLAGTFVVGNVGVLCKRKGTDLFIEVCSKVASQNKSIKFCWIGKFEDTEIETELTELIRQKNIGDNIILTGPLPHHYYNFCSFDLLFLSSREDPYPLVVMEAAFMKVPSICFENSGGIAEFVDSDAGWLIKDFSIDDTAQKIIDLYNKSKQQITDKGEAACKKALRLHSNKEVILDQFNELISSL